MKFLRLFFPLLFCGASLVACHEKKTNDNVHIRHYAQVMENIRNAFEYILPEKSSFEL